MGILNVDIENTTDSVKDSIERFNNQFVDVAKQIYDHLALGGGLPRIFEIYGEICLFGEPKKETTSQGGVIFHSPPGAKIIHTSDTYRLTTPDDVERQVRENILRRYPNLRGQYNTKILLSIYHFNNPSR